MRHSRFGAPDGATRGTADRLTLGAADAIFNIIGGAPVSTVTVRFAGRRWSADLLLSAKLSIANNNGNFALAA